MQLRKILITGSTDGIGKSVAMKLASAGHCIIVHGRSEKRVRDTSLFLKSCVSHTEIYGFAADFASFEQIRRFSDKLHGKFERIDILINNAGTFMPSKLITIDGNEVTFQVNYLAHFLLTLLLLDLLLKGRHPRIVNVSSMAHAGNIDFENLNGEKSYNGYGAYILSKLCNLIFTIELSQRLEHKNITVNCLHPGVIDTKLLKTGWSIAGSPIEIGAENVTWIALSKDINNLSGKYFVNKKPSPYARIADDEKIRKRLWEISETLTGINFDKTL